MMYAYPRSLHDARMHPQPGWQVVRIVIADDHQLVRAGMHALLAQHEDFRVVGHACDGHKLLQLLDTVEVDVVLCDLNMPRMDGMECVSRVRDEHPSVRLIVLSMDEAAATVRMAIGRGAAGYIVKQAAPAELSVAVRTVAEGGRYLSPVLTRQMLQEPKEDPAQDLTQRQLEILAQVAQGRSSREIAAALDLSPKTVDAHRARIHERLNVRDIAGLSRYAIRHRLVR